MKITILTLFPDMFVGPFHTSILKHAQEKKLVTIKLINIRDFGIGKHKTVDDTVYGGGLGMVMRVDVLHRAVEAARDLKLKRTEERVILLGAHGKVFSQSYAKSLTHYRHIILLCGHYEGVDERIKHFIDDEISIGDFITTGGEIPAMLVTDAVIRLLPGVLKKGATEEESFSMMHDTDTILEHPQYTKPRNYNELSVPDVLLSGNHADIASWRKKESLAVTQKNRSDLLTKKS